MATQRNINARLHFTRTFRTRLPREFRNLIYSALLDDDTMIQLLDVSRYPARSNHFWSAPPQFTGIPNYLRPSYIDFEVAREIVTRFYTLCGIPTFSKPASLEDFFRIVYFEVGVMPADVVLPRIKVSVWINQEDVSKIREQFRSLFNANQKGTSREKAELRLGCYELFLVVEEAKKLVAPMLKALRPVVKGTEGGGGEVVIEMDFGFETGGDPPCENCKCESEKLDKIEKDW